MQPRKVKSWEDLVNDGENYGIKERALTPTEKIIVESVKDKKVLKIQDSFAFSKTGDVGGPDHGKQLAEIIANFEYLKGITSLIITHNHLGPEGVRILSESPYLTRIEYLHLGSNHLGDEGAKIVAGAKIFCNLRTLNLECNQIQAEGARALAASPYLGKLDYLNIVDNKVGDEGALAIADSDTLSHLTYLHLGGNRIRSDEAKKAVRESKKLARLETLKIF